jgi:hypothetical protein
MTVKVDTPGATEVTEKIADLVAHSPAGGIFTYASLTRVSSYEVFGVAGFTITIDDVEYEVAVRKATDHV